MLRRPGLPLFLLVFGAYAYFYQAGGWNQNSRFDLIRSLVEQRTAVIDAYVANTGDSSERNGHYFCDKAPGISFMGVPMYAVWHALADASPPGSPSLDDAAYATTLFAVALPSALGVVAFAWLLGLLGAPRSLSVLGALAYGLGTLSFPYATLLYGHQILAVCLLGAFVLLVRARREQIYGARSLFLAGFLLGWGVLVEYPAALAGAVFFVYAAAFVRPWPRLAWIVAGGLPPVILLAAYHTLCFGGPFTLPYSFSTMIHRHLGVFMGIGPPNWGALAQILVTPFRGLFYSSPWLLAGVVGVGLLIRQRATRAEGTVCAVVFVLFVWLNISLVESWNGGWTFGARYLVPAIPFLATGIAMLPMRGHAARVLVPAFVILAGVSIFLMLAGTAVKPEVPDQIQRPFEEYLLPRFMRGELSVNTQSIDMKAPPENAPSRAWNVGQQLGLRGIASLLPLFAWIGLCGGWLLATTRAPRIQPEGT